MSNAEQNVILAAKHCVDRVYATRERMLRKHIPSIDDATQYELRTDGVFPSINSSVMCELWRGNELIAMWRESMIQEGEFVFRLQVDELPALREGGT